jgi:hypothetical protein
LPRAAREHVRVARRLPELPVIQAAFARGELSYSKVRALTRIADPDTEEDLLTMGRALTASQLERAVRALRRVTTEEANDLHDGAFLTTFWNDDGSLAIHGRLAPEDGAVVLRALDAARDQLWEGREGGSAEPPASAETLVASRRPRSPRHRPVRVVSATRWSCTSTLTRSPAKTAAAPSTTKPLTRRRRRGASPAMPPW